MAGGNAPKLTKGARQRRAVESWCPGQRTLQRCPPPAPCCTTPLTSSFAALALPSRALPPLSSCSPPTSPPPPVGLVLAASASSFPSSSSCSDVRVRGLFTSCAARCSLSTPRAARYSWSLALAMLSTSAAADARRVSLENDVIRNSVNKSINHWLLVTKKVEESMQKRERGSLYVQVLRSDV